MDVMTILGRSSGMPPAMGGMGISLSQIVMFAVAIIGLTILMRSTFARARNSSRKPLESVKERYNNLSSQREARDDVQHVMIELDRLARQIHGRIDTKFAKLEAVIRHADARIDELSRLLRTAQGKETVDTTVTCTQPRETVVTPARAGRSQNATIYELADGRIAADEIARRVGKTTGEIELILALRRTKAEGERAAAAAGRA